MKSKSDADKIHDDAKPQYVKSHEGADNSGVSSAEPRVITGDEDATFETHPDEKKSRREKSK
ncbi:hypothetical protein [Oryzicola mucosus]|uniref:Uncharacterized protein n=1 Tax=Oryzicola mucosus TaxID=2767425 RepID=A0A8J6PVS7_9HYPH|nr:hypothetical protein [Oryzicola mucosus]MBD0416969.1 hypothetical protein [Oryzicola mucosus]